MLMIRLYRFLKNIRLEVLRKEIFQIFVKHQILLKPPKVGHLTPEGLKEISVLKEGMNRKRMI